MFHLHCKCFTFLGDCTRRNAMKRSIENCLLYVQEETIFIKSLQLQYQVLEFHILMRRRNFNLREFQV